MLKINHIQIPSTEGKHWLFTIHKTFPKNLVGKKMEHDFLGQYLPETSRSNGISEYSHNFKFRTECSKRKFVFHFLKAIYDTWVSGLRALFWYRPELICINGKRDSRKKKLSVLNFWFAYHFPKRWTNKFYYVSKYNSKQPLCTIPYHQVNSVISLRTSNRPGLMNFYFCVVHLRKSESQGRANSIAVRLSHFLHNQGILHKPWAWRRRRYVIFILRCARS